MFSFGYSLTGGNLTCHRERERLRRAPAVLSLSVLIDQNGCLDICPFFLSCFCSLISLDRCGLFFISISLRLEPTKGVFVLFLVSIDRESEEIQSVIENADHQMCGSR